MYVIEYFENKYGKREKTFKRSYNVDDSLYTQLESFSKVYRATISDLLSDCLEHLIKTENIAVYDKNASELSIKRTFSVKESAIQGLYDLSQRFNISVSLLVNIAIRNMLNEKDVTKGS